MKNKITVWISSVMLPMLSTFVGAQTIEQPEQIITEAAPFTGDQINLIIMMLCISGTALILLLLVSFLQKNKKK